MRVSVLRTLKVEENGLLIRPIASGTRQVVTWLAGHARQMVSDRIPMEQLRRVKRPSNSLQSVHTYVLRLRRLINEAHGGRVWRGAWALRVLATFWGTAVAVALREAR